MEKYYKLIADCTKSIADYESIDDTDTTLAIKLELSREYSKRGACYGKLGDVTKSIEDQSKALDIAPDNANASYNRGVVYVIAGKYPEAIADYSDAIKLNPKDAQAYLNRGIAFDNLGNYPRAIQDYTTAINITPEYPKAYFQRGITYKRIGNYTKSLADYNTNIEDYKKNSYKNLSQKLKTIIADTYLNRGVMYGEKHNARNDYHNAIELNPKLAGAYFNLGLLDDKLPDNNRALNNYKEALKHDVENKNQQQYKNKILYRFRTISKDIIAELVLKKFFVSNPQKFNDPYDCDIIDKISHKPVLKKFFQQFRIASMSFSTDTCKEVWNNILMWSHYADSHKGICIGYRFKEEFFQKNKKYFIGKINYQDTIKYDTTTILWESGLLLKHKNWEYENEYRLIYHLDDDTDEPTLLPMSDGIDIAEIIFGIDCTDDYCAMIYGLFDEETREKINFKTAHKNQENLFDLKLEDYNPPPTPVKKT